LALQPLPPRTAKQIVKYLSSHTFLAKGALMMAIGTCTSEDTDTVGLVAQPLAEWANLIPDIIGQDNSMGLIGGMQSPEWQTRRAAVECLRALVISAGPAFPSSITPTSEVCLLVSPAKALLQKHSLRLVFACQFYLHPLPPLFRIKHRLKSMAKIKTRVLQVENTLNRITSSLQKLKFDKVKLVRDSVMDALHVMACLKV
jgi:hypothetical protein